MGDYLNGELLVSTSWVESNLDKPGVRLVEVDVDTKAYDDRHIPQAVGWSWKTQLCDTVRRDIIPKPQFEALMRESGISNATTVVLYGDDNNCFATWAFWQLKIYGQRDVRLMNGGRKKWLAEGRDLTKGNPKLAPVNYTAANPNFSIRAHLQQVREASVKGTHDLVDVRNPQEFTGEILAPPRPAGDVPARGAYSGCAQYTVVARVQRRRNFQAIRRTGGIVWRTGHRRIPACDRLLLDRGAFKSYLVRAALPAWLLASAELRRRVDGMGKSHRGACGEGAVECAYSHSRPSYKPLPWQVN
jgi:hypothetical protein